MDSGRVGLYFKGYIPMCTVPVQSDWEGEDDVDVSVA